MNKKQILQIIGIILLVVAVPVTFYLVRNQQIFRSRAADTNSYSLKNANGSPLPVYSDGWLTTTSQVTLIVNSVQSSPSPVASASPAQSASPVVSSSPTASSSPASSASPAPSVSPSPAASASPATSPSPSASASVQGTAFRVSFDSSFPADKTQQGNLDSTNQAIINLTLPAAGSNTAYVQFSDNGGQSWYGVDPNTTTPQVATITLVQ